MATLIACDTKYEYPGYFNVEGANSKAHCLMELYRRDDDMSVVMCTELASNPGASVTNRAEVIATQIVRQFGMKPENLTFVECYDERSYNGGRHKAQFAMVGFLWENGIASKPQWTYLESIDELLNPAEDRAGWLYSDHPF